MLDCPPFDAVIWKALPLSWTRDPFDRLLVAHAKHRGWRFATSDQEISQHLPAASLLAL